MYVYVYTSEYEYVLMYISAGIYDGWVSFLCTNAPHTKHISSATCYKIKLSNLPR